VPEHTGLFAFGAQRLIRRLARKEGDVRKVARGGDVASGAGVEWSRERSTGLSQGEKDAREVPGILGLPV